MKSAMLCGAVAVALVFAAMAEAGGPGQKYYVGNYYGHAHGGGIVGGHHGHHGYNFGHCCPPGYDVNAYAMWGQYYGGHGGYGGYGAYGSAYGVPALAPPAYNAGPPTPAVTYPYYTTRGPRDFLLDNPPSLGP